MKFRSKPLNDLSQNRNTFQSFRTVVAYRMAEKGVEKTETGVKKTGSWREMSKFGKKVEEVLKSTSINASSIKKFSEWRPRIEEAEADVKKKTVEAATLEEKDIESKTEGVKEDLGKASEKVVKASERVRSGETPESEIAGASKKAAHPILSSILRSIRQVERYVYSGFMMRFNSFYLDTEEISVQVNNHSGGDYSMDVKVSGEENRSEVQKSFEEEG